MKTCLFRELPNSDFVDFLFNLELCLRDVVVAVHCAFGTLFFLTFMGPDSLTSFNQSFVAR